MQTIWIVVSVIALIVSVLAYGFAGAQLHEGSQGAPEGSEGGGTSALRSRAWWMGTGLQGLGFLSALVARRSLPVLIVQAAGSAGLAVTAAVQHVSGVHRMARRQWWLIGAVVLGLALIAAGTVPGAAVAIAARHEWFLAVCAVVCGLGVLAPVRAFPTGLLSGLGFAYAAIGARLVMGDVAHPLWIFWHLPASTWVVGLLTGTGIVLGQLHLTRGLARSDAAPVLSAMYLVETLLPAAIGPWLLHEYPRHGMAPVMVLGVVASVVASVGLARQS